MAPSQRANLWVFTHHRNLDTPTVLNQMNHYSLSCCCFYITALLQRQTARLASAGYTLPTSYTRPTALFSCSIPYICSSTAYYDCTLFSLHAHVPMCDWPGQCTLHTIVHLFTTLYCICFTAGTLGNYSLQPSRHTFWSSKAKGWQARPQHLQLRCHAPAAITHCTVAAHMPATEPQTDCCCQQWPPRGCTFAVQSGRHDLARHGSLLGAAASSCALHC